MYEKNSRLKKLLNHEMESEISEPFEYCSEINYSDLEDISISSNKKILSDLNIFDGFIYYIKKLLSIFY